MDSIPHNIDHNGAVNVSRRKGDNELAVCKGRKFIKALLMKRHEQWKQEHGMETSQTTRKRRGKGTKEQIRSKSARKTRVPSEYSLLQMRDNQDRPTKTYLLYLLFI